MKRLNLCSKLNATCNLLISVTILGKYQKCIQKLPVLLKTVFFTWPNTEPTAFKCQSNSHESKFGITLPTILNISRPILFLKDIINLILLSFILINYIKLIQQKCGIVCIVYLSLFFSQSCLNKITPEDPNVLYSILGETDCWVLVLLLFFYRCGVIDREILFYVFAFCHSCKNTDKLICCFVNLQKNNYSNVEILLGSQVEVFSIVSDVPVLLSSVRQIGNKLLLLVVVVFFQMRYNLKPMTFLLFLIWQVFASHTITIKC